MVKISSGNTSDDFHTSEQYRDCSNLLKEADPPLEELDPAILSCGLPAIMLSDIHPILAAPIRYTVSQLQAIRKHSLSFRRPAIADDPKLARFGIWRPSNAHRKSCLKERKPNRVDETSKERSPNAHHGRDNGFVAPRVRRNYEFSNRNHHVIVKSYKSDEYHRLQDTAIEEEPEWVASGPTSRLDTIELHGFDDDVSMSALSTSQTSLEKIGSTESKVAGSKATGKHISFYDELHHYEHVHSKRTGGNVSKQHDTSSGRENDMESVATSSTGSPPPARSTPTKSISDTTNSYTSGQKLSQQSQNNSINVNNFEEFMKFESLFGSDNGSVGQTGSRFSKWFRRGNNASNQISHQDVRRASYHPSNDTFGNVYNANGQRYQQERHPQRFSNGTAQCPRSYQGPAAFEQHNPINAAASNTALKRLVEMVAQNRANNNLLAQQQYLMQLLNKNQQSEILRRMLMKNTVDNAADSGQQQAPPQQPQQPRIPTQRELQFHTQSIMQNALLRKKLQDQRKMLFEQNNQMAVMAAAAAVSAEPNATVQQFVQSVCPNVQRSLSVLGQTKANQHNQQKFDQSFLNGSGQTQHDLSASLQQMLLSPPQQRSVGCRFGKA
ncbi:protein cup isoform X2 [Wyeomyia smithii]|uniref:protein cup isoform X2 n=1 Tax=Wyeomyia smithii TaxID=174621 RepID=UPI002467B102|nr:protein cup isoform X2 [Wyeomyia smithii]